ncbi:MAG: hypothetical protein LWX83_19015, partial [Anaerolineae bacterium]|nr:hypothetical protein [Anaerolineae bacterium]
MSILTSKAIKDFPFAYYADAKTIQRGRVYFKEGRVWNIDMHGNSRAICDVEGSNGDYTVEVGINQKTGQLYFECDCPYAENYFCKHMVAAALELSEYLKNEEETNETKTTTRTSKW